MIWICQISPNSLDGPWNCQRHEFVYSFQEESSQDTHKCKRWNLPLLFCLEFSQCAVDSTIPTTVDICLTPTVRPNPRTCNVGRTETRIITTAISPKPTARTTHSTDGTRGPVPWTVSLPPPPANPSAGEAAPIPPRPQSTGPRLPLTSSV